MAESGKIRVYILQKTERLGVEKINMFMWYTNSVLEMTKGSSVSILESEYFLAFVNKGLQENFQGKILRPAKEVV